MRKIKLKRWTPKIPRGVQVMTEEQYRNWMLELERAERLEREREAKAQYWTRLLEGIRHYGD